MGGWVKLAPSDSCGVRLRFGRDIFIVFIYRSGLVVVAAALMVVPSFATKTHHSQSSSHKAVSGSSSRHKGSRKNVSASHKLHGQQGIDSGRATEIQQALIREHYMSGSPSGEWDSETVAAMQKYQSDQGWQTKLTPDSRALQKLGLGADYSKAINANGSSFSPSTGAGTTTQAQAGFVAASGVQR